MAINWRLIRKVIRNPLFIFVGARLSTWGLAGFPDQILASIFDVQMLPLG